MREFRLPAVGALARRQPRLLAMDPWPAPPSRDPLRVMIAASGRSWWQARYTDGRVLGEWQTGKMKVSHRANCPFRESQGRLVCDCPLSAARGADVGKLDPTNVAQATTRWEEVPKRHMIGLRLLCPSGKAGDLEAKRDFLLFQFKVSMSVTSGPVRRPVLAHVIGLAEDDGACLCHAWEPSLFYDDGAIRQAARLITFNDNLHNMAYHGLGRMSFEVLGVRIGGTPARSTGQ